MPRRHKRISYDDEILNYKNMYQSIFDTFINEILYRFEPKNLKHLIFIFNLLNSCNNNISKSDLKNELEIYSDLINFDELFLELSLFQNSKSLFHNFDMLLFKLRNNKGFKEHFISACKNMTILLKIYLTSPIANVTSERGFSCLKRVKTYLRSTMHQDRLSSISILNFENHMLYLIDLDEALNEFASIKERNMKFY